MLTLENLSVGYDSTHEAILAALNLCAQPCKFICVLGRNGAGKSTLMRTIAGLQRPLAGKAALDNENIEMMRAATRARRISVVLTERQFSPGLKVDDVVSLGRQPFTTWQGKLSHEDREIVAEALERTKATRFTGRFFDDLSDGERQRVLIARAIAQTSRLMILDEITAFLDLPGRVEVMTMLRRYARDNRAVVILSSHDLDLSLQLADEIWLLDGKGGFITGEPAQLANEGAVGAAFDNEDVAFVPALGRFELRH